MEKYWIEEMDGLLFHNIPDGSSQQERLEMLYYEGSAEINEADYYMPYDYVVDLSSEDCELFALPERNPYQISINADGTVGYNDLHYVFNVLKPDGQQFVNPKIVGCILYIDKDRQYILSKEQYKLVKLLTESNLTVPQLDRRELTEYSLTNLGRIQRHAKKSDTRLDAVLSEKNQKIILPENLDVEFCDDGKGNIEITPVILEEGTGDELSKENQQKFLKEFERPGVRSVYKSRTDEGNIKFVIPSKVRDGLQKIKDINKAKLTPQDAERFTKQPRELLEDEVFIFRKKEGVVSKTSDNDIEEESVWKELPQEGECVTAEYSDRVKGMTNIRRAIYYGSGHKTDWLGQEGTSEEVNKQDAPINDMEKEAKSTTEAQESNKLKEESEEMSDEGRFLTEHHNNQFSNDDNEEDVKEYVKTGPMALDIKPNFELADYSPDLHPRKGAMDASALKEEISLYDYQEDAVNWMFKAWTEGYKGVLLADDMGLGKTLQTLAFIAELKKGSGSSCNKPILIVGPTALLTNWENEYNKFLNSNVFSGVTALHGASIKKYQTGDLAPNQKKKLILDIDSKTIALTTYETLRDYQFSFAEVEWGIIIVDEAQKIKNPSTGVTTSIKAMNYDYAICLSGTPVENSWTDLWSIMDFVHPMYLRTLREFREKYISRLKDLNGDIHGIEKLGVELKKSLNPLFLRRMKKDKLQGIPKKEVHVCRLNMPKYQKERYIAVLEEARRDEVHPLVTIAKLRDISLHPDLSIKQLDKFYQMDAWDVINQSARLIQTFDILQEIKKNDEKALVFVVSKKMQNILRHLIKSVFNITVNPPINGTMNGIARQRTIDKFNSIEGFGVLILSPEAAGVGFTITSANHVIHLSRTWNPAKEDQATDRVYRIGQKRDVHVYLPLACNGHLGNSFDEKLNELLDYKRRLSENVMFPTGDDARDGQHIFNGCVSKEDEKASSERNCYVSISDVDDVIADVFEIIIKDLYSKVDGCRAIKTKRSHDNGADVVVLFDDGKSGLLVQCKHQDNPNSAQGKKGVQEVYAAVNYYKNLDEYKGIEFGTVVVTNAIGFTSETIKLAKDNDVKLIARDGLETMLKEYALPYVY